MYGKQRGGPFQLPFVGHWSVKLKSFEKLSRARMRSVVVRSKALAPVPRAIVVSENAVGIL